LSFRLGKWISFSALLLVLAILLYGAWNRYASQKMGGVPSQFRVFEDQPGLFGARANVVSTRRQEL
jgi:hypothetical protein